MKIRNVFFLCFFLIGAAFTSKAQIGPIGSCTSTHINPVISTGPVSVLTCQNQTISAYATPHCNATGTYGYKFVITNGSYSKSYVRHSSSWSGTCHDLKCGMNDIKVYYRSSPGGSWQEYAQGGIYLSDCDI